MKTLDRFLQSWRAAKAKPWINDGARVLDIGCHQGELLRELEPKLGPSVGLDPLLEHQQSGKVELIPDVFPTQTPLPDQQFDAIVMLATLEHIHDKETLSRECFRVLAPGGRVIITVPSSLVDHIIHALCKLKLADGMSLDEHHGYDPKTTPEVFGKNGFVLEHHRRFQLGLNHLFVLKKP